MPLFNLIVSHQPGRAGYLEALRYLRAYLEGFQVFYSRQSIILARVPDPYRAVKVLADRLPPDSPILRVIPVDEVTPSYLEDVVEKVKVLYPRRIPRDARFAVRVEGRLYRREGGEVSRLEAHRVIGGVVDRPVDLRNPDYLVLVKVVRVSGGGYAGIMIAPPSSIYSRARSS